MVKMTNSLYDNMISRPIVAFCAFIFCCSCLCVDYRVVCVDTNDVYEYHLEVDSYAVRNHRKHMEDRYFIEEKINGTNVSLFGVFDGHGGKYVSSKARSQLMPSIRKKIRQMIKLKKNGFPTATPNDTISKFSAEYYVREFGVGDDNLVQAFKQMLHTEILIFDQKMLLVPENNFCGCTAVIAVITNHYLIVANVGDSRAILGNTADKAIRITKDHKPDDAVEKARIESVKNGKVTIRKFDVPRVNNILAMSRALGNSFLKKRQLIVPTPDMFVINFREPKYHPKYLVLASDGIWDVMDDQDVIDFIIENSHTDDVARRITQEAINWYSHDNIAILIVSFQSAFNVHNNEILEDDSDDAEDEYEDDSTNSDEVIKKSNHDEL